MDTTRLLGKHVMITGAARGMGAAIKGGGFSIR